MSDLSGLILDATTSLEVDLTGAVATNQLPFVVCYLVLNKSTLKPVDDGATTETGQTNNTTAVTMLAAPAANTKRVLKYLSLKNSDTAAVELWVQVNDNATLREIWKGTLAVGDTLVYIDSAGWSVINSSGQIKTGDAPTFTATRVPFAGADSLLTSDAGFVFNTTGDILTVGAINVAGTTAPTVGLYNPSGTLLRTPNALTVDGALTPAQVAGIVGTTTNNNAAAGSVGEVITLSVAVGAAVSLVNATAKTITSISLTAGDWDIFGTVAFNGGATTNTTLLVGGISTVDNTLPTLYEEQTTENSALTTPFASNPVGIILPTTRVSLSGTTTYYLVGYAAFTVSTATGFGRITARRVR